MTGVTSVTQADEQANNPNRAYDLMIFPPSEAIQTASENHDNVIVYVVNKELY